MRIAIAQLNYSISDFALNTKKIIESIDKAKAGGAKLVIFSEMAISGYFPHDLLLRKNFIEQAEQALNNIAAHCFDITAIVGGPSIQHHERFNSAFVMYDGAIRHIVNKTVLASHDVVDECRYFVPNNNYSVFDIDNEKIAITISEDIGNEIVAGSPLDQLAGLHPSVVVNISATPFAASDNSTSRNILSKNAAHYRVPIVNVNQVGGYGELIFEGDSSYIDENGETIEELKSFEEDFRIIDTVSTSKNIKPQAERIEKTYQALVLGIGDYFSKTGFKRAILGLSGGIDSALVAALAVKALGSQNVRGLLMPSRYSSGHSIDDAVQLAKNLEIKYDIVPIQPMVERFEQSLSGIFNNLPADITEENLQARTRGILLMAISNKFGDILLNTSNKSELSVGYGTLYGDMNGGISVLGDVYKTDVYKLSRWINKEYEVIPNNTMIKPPSAELRPDQLDSDSLPDYGTMDRILSAYIESNMTPDEIIANGFDEATVKRIVNMVNKAEYKRCQSPPILKVTTKAFGLGRRIPLVSR